MREIKHIVSAVLLMAFFYIAFAFVANEFNSIKWSWDARYLYATISVLIVYAVIAHYKIEGMK